MKRQPTWDKYEVALLVEAHLAIEKENTKKIEILQVLSETLRRKAINEGMVIDDTFRNLNGMQWQLGFVKCAFGNNSYSSHRPSKMFREIVNMYLYEKERFDEILAEAKRKSSPFIENKNQDMLESRDRRMRKERFIHWLEKEIGFEKTRKDILNTIEECSEYAVTHKKTKLTIWDIRNVGLYENLIECLFKDKFFKLLNKNLAYSLGKYSQTYAKFLRQDKGKVDIKENIVEPIMPAMVEPREDNVKNQVVEIVGTRFAYGYRLGSPIDLMKLREYIKEANIEVTKSDEELELFIRKAGFITNGKVFVIASEVKERLNTSLNDIFEQGATVIYYESFIERNRVWLENVHILSEDMLKELLAKTRADLSYSKNFMSNGEKKTEELSVATEICRVWGQEIVISVEEIADRLPYIPFDKVRFYLSVNRLFAWVSEGVYARVNTLVVTEKEEKDIISYVNSECNEKGFASLSNIPLGDIVEQNYELSDSAIITSVYNKYLANDYFLNGKIVTREKSEIDINLILGQFCAEKEEYTLDEALEKVKELTGTRDRRIAYPVLYNTMVRIDEQKFVSDKAVNFDAVTIDEVIGTLIKDGFAAIKEITTFATLPMCGQSWNHYLLESYCYRFSKRYAYRTNLFNGRNAGAIVEQSIDWDYKELLSQAVARSSIRLDEDAIGQFLFEAGYMAKSKFTWAADIVERAKQIREENV